MKFLKTSFLSAFAFLAIATTVLFSACEQDSCLDLTCQNAGSCAEGFCRCQTGYEGAECQIKAATKFVGFYVGNIKCGALPPLKDTVEIILVKNPDQVKLVQRSRPMDTLFGTAKGQDLIINEITAGDYRRTFNAVSENNKLTFSSEEIFNVNTGDKTVCQFIGFK